MSEYHENAQRFERLRQTIHTASPPESQAQCATRKPLLRVAFVVSVHCRSCTKQCAEITKDAVQSTAFLLHIVKDSKGKALSGADFVCGVANPDTQQTLHTLYQEKNEHSEVNPAYLPFAIR